MLVYPTICCSVIAVLQYGFLCSVHFKYGSLQHCMYCCFLLSPSLYSVQESPECVLLLWRQRRQQALNFRPLFGETKWILVFKSCSESCQLQDLQFWFKDLSPEGSLTWALLKGMPQNLCDAVKSFCGHLSNSRFSCRCCSTISFMFLHLCWGVQHCKNIKYS